MSNSDGYTQSMRTAEVIAHFKTQKAVAHALGIRQPSVAAWGEYPPDTRQLQIERVTRKTLRAEPECLQRLTGVADLRSLPKTQQKVRA